MSLIHKPCEKPRAHPTNTGTCWFRVAGYSDYFVDLDEYHQEEIIARTEQESF